MMFSWYKKLQALTYALFKLGGIGGLYRLTNVHYKEKYEVGRIVRKKWVVCGICYEKNEVFMIETFYQNQATLEEIIQKKCGARNNDHY